MYMTPQEIYKEAFICFYNSDLQFRSIEALKDLYCGLLSVVGFVCEDEYEQNQGNKRIKYNNYTKRVKKMRIRITARLRHMDEEEAKRLYLLTIIYDEVLKGYTSEDGNYHQYRKSN